MSRTLDVVVIGAGHNGLVTAAVLAKAGLDTLVLERRERVGGATVTEPFAPGFRVDTGAHRLGGLDPRVVLALELDKRGVEVVDADPALVALHEDGDNLVIRRDPTDACEDLRRLSRPDAERWVSFNEHMLKTARLLRGLYQRPPPAMPRPAMRDLRGIVPIGQWLRKAGREEIVEALRLLPMPVADLVDDWFETDLLKGAVAAVGIHGVAVGPMAAGTTYVLLHHNALHDGTCVCGTRLVRGGMTVLTSALEQAAREVGAEIRTNATVGGIHVRDGRATHVLLDDGQELSARCIVSNADPRRTLLTLLERGNLDPNIVRDVRNITYRGVLAKVHFALDTLPRFRGVEHEERLLAGRVVVGPSVAYLERASDDAKYGSVSREPYVECTIPSLLDPSLAPAGKHMLSAYVQYAPYDVQGGWSSAARERLADAVVNTLARYAPDLPSTILHRHVASPKDLEDSFSLTEGNGYHGELSLDQILFMRPIPGSANYQTPVPNLFLCGTGTHPATGVSGTSGFNAAREVLRWTRRRD
jgi:phytoene dehydrogenase-like protein